MGLAERPEGAQRIDLNQESGLTLETWVYELLGKQSQMGLLPGKLLVLSLVDGFPGRVEGLNLLLILWKEILIHFFKK